MSSAPARPRQQGVIRSGVRCACNATSSVCFGFILLLILGPALLSPKIMKSLGGGSPRGLTALSELALPLAAGAVIAALVGGTLSANRRQRNLAAALFGLLIALAALRWLQAI